MKFLFLAVLLSVMQAAPPVPRQASNSPANASSHIQSNTTKDKTPATSSETSVKAQSTQHDKETSDGQGKENTQHSISVTKLPPVTIASPKRDWADWGTWGFNLLLVITSAFQVWLLCKTLMFISRQTHEIKRQRVTMGGQLKTMQSQLAAMEKQTAHLEASVEVAREAADAAKRNVELIINKERAHIRIEVSALKLPTSRAWNHVEFKVHLLGPTLAFIVESGVLAITTTDESKTPTSEFHIPVSIPETFSPSLQEKPQYAILFGINRDPTKIESIKKRELFVHFYGFIKYRDIFEIPRETRFSYVWDEIPGLSGNWRKCGQKSDNIET